MAEILAIMSISSAPSAIAFFASAIFPSVFPAPNGKSATVMTLMPVPSNVSLANLT